MGLVHIIEFVFLALCSAGLELSFQQYMSKDHILRFWAIWLRNLSYKGSWAKKLSFVLGGCRWCNGFWVAAGVYLLYYKELSGMILLFTGVNYIFLKWLTNTIDSD